MKKALVIIKDILLSLLIIPYCLWTMVVVFKENREY